MSDEAERRVDVLADLRVMLDWLEANPDVLFDSYTARMSHIVLTDDDAIGTAEVRRVAEALGVQTVTSPGAGHLSAELAFGAASYRIVYVPATAR